MLLYRAEPTKRYSNCAVSRAVCLEEIRSLRERLSQHFSNEYEARSRRLTGVEAVPLAGQCFG